MADFKDLFDKHYRDFFPDKLHYEFVELIVNENVDAFHKCMATFMDEEIIKKCMIKHNIQTNLEEFKTTIKKAIAYYFVSHGKGIKLLKILVTEYDYIPTAEVLLAYNLHYMPEEIILYFQNFIDPIEYIEIMRIRFQFLCWDGKLTDLKRIIDAGFDIQDMIKVSKNESYDETIILTALKNPDVTVLKYLLENDINYKSYEMDILKTCIDMRRLRHLKILIEHGIDVTVLGKIDINDKYEFSSEDVEMCKLLLDNVNPLIVVLLMNRM